MAKKPRRRLGASLFTSIPAEIRASLAIDYTIRQGELLLQECEERARTTSKAAERETSTDTFDSLVRSVERYEHESQVPEHLKKCAYTPISYFSLLTTPYSEDFSQRNRYFSLYDHGCLLDEEGWYSVTPEALANQIAVRCRCDTILDAFCGIGGNAIAFAKTCERVVALDNSPTRLALARHNARIYGVESRIEFILTDYISFAHSLLSSPHPRIFDVVFLSPPWGGPSYLTSTSSYRLSNITPLPGADLFTLSRKLTHNVAFFLPRNTDLGDISDLVDVDGEKVEVEEGRMGSKLKALTCYSGGLVVGQEGLFDED